MYIQCLQWLSAWQFTSPCWLQSIMCQLIAAERYCSTGVFYLYLCTEPTSHALAISWCSLLNRLSPPCFHTSAGIPSPPGALPSFRQAIALAISSMVGISSRLVLVMRCGMLSRAAWFMSPWTLSSFWKCSLHLATTQLLSEKVSIPSGDFRWTSCKCTLM